MNKLAYIPKEINGYSIYINDRKKEEDTPITLLNFDDGLYVEEYYSSFIKSYFNVKPSVYEGLVHLIPKYVYETNEIKEVWEEGERVWINDDLSDKGTPDFLSLSYKSYSIPKVDNKSTSKFIESIPKLIQFLNLLDKATYSDIEEAGSLGMYRAEVAALAVIKASTIPELNQISDSVCFPIPKLSTYEAEISITGINSSLLTFSYKGEKGIGVNTPIQIEVNQYTNLYNRTLVKEESDRYYNPTFINYRVRSYSSKEGAGVASLEINQRLMLRDEDGVLLKYYTKDIGSKIYPVIESAFVVV